MAMKMSVRRLRLAGACEDQVQAFKDRFGGKTVVVTEALCVEHAEVFDWLWAANAFFTDAQQRAYDEAVAPARRAYHEAMASAERAYTEAVASAQRAYTEAVASAQRVYHEAWASARRAYREALARAFGKIAETIE